MSFAKKINVEKILSPVFKEKKELMVFYKIAQQWKNFVGQSFVNTTLPLKLSREKVLFLAVPNSSVSSQFHYSKEKVISNIRSHFGHDAISDIKLIAKPSDKWEPLKSLSPEINEKKISNNSKKEVDLEGNLTKLLTSIRENF